MRSSPKRKKRKSRRSRSYKRRYGSSTDTIHREIASFMKDVDYEPSPEVEGYSPGEIARRMVVDFQERGTMSILNEKLKEGSQESLWKKHVLDEMERLLARTFVFEFIKTKSLNDLVNHVNNFLPIDWRPTILNEIPTVILLIRAARGAVVENYYKNEIPDLKAPGYLISSQMYKELFLREKSKLKEIGFKKLKSSAIDDAYKHYYDEEIPDLRAPDDFVSPPVYKKLVLKEKSKLKKESKIVVSQQKREWEEYLKREREKDPNFPR